MKKIYLLFSFTLLILSPFAHSQNSWVQKANFGGTARYVPISFSIGTKGYIGAGIDAVGNKADLWEWDQSTNAWTQKAGLNTARRAAMSFAINGIGYCCCGFGSAWLGDMWAYDPSLNSWTQKANFGGTSRYGSAGFAIGNKGYIGLGADAGGNGPYATNFWEYDPSTNGWTQKASPAMPQRYGCVGFSVGTKGYMGMGGDGSVPVAYHDLYQYDQTTNMWTAKATLPGNAGGGYPAAFSMAGKGYICGGNSNGTQMEFWEYNPALDNWTQRANYAGGNIFGAAGFSIGAKGYVGTGWDLINASTNTFYEYTPINVGIDEQSSFVNHCSVYPTMIADHATLEINTTSNLMNTQLNIFDLNGKLIRTISVSSKKFTFEKGNLAEGSYLYEVIDNNEKIGLGKFIAVQ